MRSDWLDAFIAFSTRMNFTRAAEDLHISQPALHVKIKNLSEWLGVSLYHNSGRELTLTPAGERLAAFAREQSERADSFVDTLRTGESHQPVVLCAGEGAYLYLLGPALSAFSHDTTYPLRLLTGNQEHTFQALLSGEAHIGISAAETIPDGLRADVLTEVGQMLVMPEGHRLSKKRSVRLSDLDGEALIVPPDNRPHRTMINRMMMDAGVNWRVGVEANGWELMQSFVGLGSGLAIVNACCRLTPGLVAQPLPEFPHIYYHLLERSDRMQTDSGLELKKYILRHKADWSSRKRKSR